MCKVKPRLLLVTLVVILQESGATPSIEDNRLPGQPEEVSSLGLPSDEESFNQLTVFFDPSKVSGPVGSGTYHFVSSTFPVDARGFHESVFDGIGDYFPSWPAPYKRGTESFHVSPSLAQRLGLQPRNKLRKRSEPWVEPRTVRRKRGITHKNSTQELAVSKYDCTQCEGRLAKREVEDEGREKQLVEEKEKSWRVPNIQAEERELGRRLDKRSGARNVRGMEMGSSGFHGDVFNGDFGDFTTMRKRAKGSFGFHGDTFSDGFGDFTTMKRASKEEALLSKLKEYLHKLSEGGQRNSERDTFIETPEVYNRHGTFETVKRRPEMTSMGFHGDTFSGGFGDFYPAKKRRPEMDSMGFHGDTFSRGFGDFEPFKKRRPATGSMGFHGDTFSQGFGDFDTYKKRRPEMDSSGFHGDTFSRGFGEFEPFKKRRPASGSMGFHGDTFSQGFGDFDTYKKRLVGIPSLETHGNTFDGDFEEFDPLKKRRPASGSMGFHGDTFSQGFGDFDTYKKRVSDMDPLIFYGINFNKEPREVEPSNKRRPASGSMGFHGDTFSQGFGDFDTLRKRSPELDSLEIHGDNSNNDGGNVESLHKRRPASGSMGFHGDTFSQGFGDFDTYKKRRPEMDSMGFHGDTFNRGFGDFDVYKKRSIAAAESHGEVPEHNPEQEKIGDKKSCSSQSCGSH